MENTYVIRASSQKGGVGKTTVAVNLAAVLRYMQYDVLLVDADTSNPSVGAQLGLDNITVGYKELLEGDNDIESATVIYGPIDLSVIAGTMPPEPYMPTADVLGDFYKKLYKLDYDFIIVDTAPGSFFDMHAKYFNEALIITTPELASAAGAAHLAQQYDRYKVKHRLVINRVSYDKAELTQEQIEKIYGDIAYILLPEDPLVKESMSKRVPAYMLNRSSSFSLAMDDLARAYTLKAGEPTPKGRAVKNNISSRIKRIFGFK